MKSFELRKNQLIKAINEFESLIGELERAIRQQYGSNLSPLRARTQKLIPYKGQIETNLGTVDYKFHGRGCEAKFGRLTVDYDYTQACQNTGPASAMQVEALFCQDFSFLFID